MQTDNQWVKTNDGNQLFVRTWGRVKATPIVLVHGYPDSHTVWLDVAAALAKKFYVIAYDVRGAGQSSAPKQVKSYKLCVLATDLVAVVDHMIPKRKFHLVGHDWGSIQCWESATTSTLDGRILSFTTLSGPSLDHASFWLRSRAKDNRTTLLTQLMKSWYIFFFQLPWAAPMLWKFVLSKQWHRMLRFSEGVKDLPVNPSQHSDGLYGINLYRANFIDRLLSPRRRYAHCPVHAIILENDLFVGKALMDDLPKWVDNLTITPLVAGHWAILSQPLAIAEHIEQFIETLSQGALA